MTRPSETYLQNVLRESKGVSFTFSNKKLLASFIVILHLCWGFLFGVMLNGWWIGFVLGSFSWLWVVLGGCGQFWPILGGRGVLEVLANFGLLWKVVGYFDTSVECWKVFGDFGCLWLDFGSCIWFWLVLGSLGNFGWFCVVGGWFWLVVGDFGWF